MFFHFNLIKGNCTRNSDEGPFNKDSEFYWTWMVYSEKNQEIADLYQGFSLGCSLDSGYGFNDVDQQTRMLNDPKFTIELPEVAEGETKKINFELYCWESDSSSIIVKKTFTNQAAQKLWTISEQVEQQKQETQKQFFDWLEKSDNNFLENLVSTGVMTSGPIAIAQAAVPLVR